MGLKIGLYALVHINYFKCFNGPNSKPVYVLYKFIIYSSTLRNNLIFILSYFLSLIFSVVLFRTGFIFSRFWHLCFAGCQFLWVPICVNSCQPDTCQERQGQASKVICAHRGQLTPEVQHPRVSSNLLNSLSCLFLCKIVYNLCKIM